MAEDGSSERKLFQQDLITRYETMLDKLSEMLVHAKAGRWADIIEQEAEYLAQLEHIRYLEAGAQLDEAMQFHRARLGREILEKSAELKRYLTERREVLAELIEEAEQHVEVVVESEATSAEAESTEPSIPAIPDPEQANR